MSGNIITGLEHTPLVLREFVTAPFFAAKPQKKTRIIKANDAIWTLGVDHPLKRHPTPPLDIRHGQALFSMLTFRERLVNGHEIYFSMNELCHRYAESQGGRYARNLLQYLFDLEGTWVSRAPIEKDARIQTFRLIEGITVSQKPIRRRDALRALNVNQGELWIDRVVLHPEFVKLLEQIELVTRIRLDVLRSIRSPTATAIYTYLPSRAVHHGKDDPFSITLTSLLEQVGLTPSPYKSKRKETFTKNNNPILSQLDGAEIMNGGKLRCALRETKDKSDFKLITWVEGNKTVAQLPPQAPTNSKLYQAWISTGRCKKEFDERVGQAALSDHHIYLIESAKVQAKGNEKFFSMAGALLGPRFEQVLSEAKGDALEGQPGHNPTGRLIYRLTKAVKDLPRR